MFKKVLRIVAMLVFALAVGYIAMQADIAFIRMTVQDCN